MPETHNDLVLFSKKSLFGSTWCLGRSSGLCASTEVSSSSSTSELLHASFAAKCKHREVMGPGLQFPNQAPSVLLMYTNMST